ncbi:hypothetical protein ACFE04_019882 [Oxalis oulophora]
MWLTFDKIEDRDHILIDGSKWLSLEFVSFEPWSPNLKCSENICKIYLKGIPLHAWDVDFFHDLFNSWGSLVKIDEDNLNKLMLDYFQVSQESFKPLVLNSLNESDKSKEQKLSSKDEHLDEIQEAINVDSSEILGGSNDLDGNNLVIMEEKSMNLNECEILGNSNNQDMSNLNLYNVHINSIMEDNTITTGPRAVAPGAPVNGRAFLLQVEHKDVKTITFASHIRESK